MEQQNNYAEIQFLIYSFYYKMLCVMIANLVSPFFGKKKFTSYKDGILCSRNLEILLEKKICRENFLKFIEKQKKHEGNTLIFLYRKIQKFERSIDDKKENYSQKIFYYAQNILNEFRNTQICDTELYKSIAKKYHNMEISKNLFDPIYGIVINKLNEFYVDFMNSKEFIELDRILFTNKVIYERCQNANLI